MDKQTIQILKDYFNQSQEISSVVLFGSFAKASQNSQSDIDLAILTENDLRSRAPSALRRKYSKQKKGRTPKDTGDAFIVLSEMGLIGSLYIQSVKSICTYSENFQIQF